MKTEFKPRYFNDKSAPRMRKGRFTKNVITKELWMKFIKTYPEYEHMPWTEFFQNWLDIAEKIRKYTISNPLGIKLQSYMGELKLQYLPYKFRVPDEVASDELGYEVPYLSIETKGKSVRLKWERRDAVRHNKILQFYAFDPVREMGRMANKHISANPDSLRIARNTLGGHSVWRQKRNLR